MIFRISEWSWVRPTHLLKRTPSSNPVSSKILLTPSEEAAGGRRSRTPLGLITQLSVCTPLWKWKVLSRTPLWCIIVISAADVINYKRSFSPNQWSCRHSSMCLSVPPSAPSRPSIVFACASFFSSSLLFALRLRRVSEQNRVTFT